MTQDAMPHMIKTAIGAHGTWKLRLKTAITFGKTDMDTDKVYRDNCCGFGRWLQGQSSGAAN